MIPNALVQEVQIEFLKRIALLIERGKIDLKTGKEWAKELLATLPFTSLDDMKQKIQQFSQKFPMLENLSLAIQTFEANEKENKTAQQMTNLIKSEKHEEALSLAK